MRRTVSVLLTLSPFEAGRLRLPRIFGRGPRLFQFHKEITMRSNPVLGWIVGASLLCASPMQAQEPKPVGERSSSSGRELAAESSSFVMSGPVSRDAEAAAPRVLKFNGVLLDSSGKPVSGEVEVTFALYKQEGDEVPLWTETQQVTTDERGGYTALLGKTQATGIPAEVFRSDEARWLGVQVQGQVQQPRTLLVSVPYALKAAEAEKLSGKSLSDFVLSESLSDQVRRVIEGQTIIASQATSAGTVQAGQSKAGTTSSAQTAPPGPKFPPSMFSGANGTQIVSVQQSGSGNGLYAQTGSSTGNSAIVGVAISTSTSNNQNGVIGFNSGAGSGVAGIATNPSAGVGVYGQSAAFAAIFGNAISTSWTGNGVFGQSSAKNGNGVFGQALDPSGAVNGVFGHISSTGGNGVLGVADNTAGYATGVTGQTAAPFGVGVFGNATAVNGQNTGVYGQTVNWVGVGGQAAATSGGPAYGVWGDSVSTDGVGVAGYEDATSGFTNGVFGQSVSPNGTGVFGVNISATGGAGVVGVANATSGSFADGVQGVTLSTDANGVSGNATATSGFASGVFGQTASPSGYGVWGAYGFANTAPYGVGVKGSIESGVQSGVAGQFVNVPGQGLLLQGISGSAFQQVFSVDTSGNLHIAGNLTVDGTKSSTAKLQDGRVVALYAVESPENWFEDFGSTELKNGVAWIALDGSFVQAVNAAVPYHVFLTPNGDSNGLYVARKTSAGFEVREHGGGTSNLAFDYRIVARRRGFETLRLAEVHDDSKIVELTQQRLRQLAKTDARKRARAVRTAPIGPKPTIRPVSPRVSVPRPPKVSITQAPSVNAAQSLQPK